LRDMLGIRPVSIVDAGAATGTWTRAAAFVHPSSAIFAFEPLPRSFATLQELALRLPGVICFPFALGAINGPVTFYANDFPDASSMLRVTPEMSAAFPHAAQAREMSVTCRRLDAIAGLELRPPALLKLDVQGAECEVIDGCGELIGTFDAVIAEVNFTSLYERQAGFGGIRDRLEARGFTHFMQLRRDDAVWPDVHSCDVVFLHNRVGGEGRGR